MAREEWRASLASRTRAAKLATRRLLRPLLGEASRFVLSALAVTSAVTLILLFEGFQVGLYRQLRAFPEQLPTPLVVLQAGVRRIVGQRSVLPSSARAEVEAVPGVRAAHPVAGIPLIYERDGRRTPVFVIAYDTAGAPRELAAGRQIAGERELVVDSGLAKKYGFRVGTEVRVLDATFRIVGVSRGTGSMLNPYVFARYVDLLDLYLAGAFEEVAAEPSLLSLLLVEPEPHADLGDVRAAITRAAPSLAVFTPEELADADVEMGKRMFAPILSLLVWIAYFVGALVVGLTSYVSVANRSRELSVMKAIGATASRPATAIVMETVVLSALSLVLGVGTAIGVARTIEWLAPQYSIVPASLEAIGRTSLAVAMIAAIGGLAPLRQVASVEPATAFRS